MNRLTLFFKKIYVFLLFLTLEAAVLNYYANSTSQTKARMLAVANSVVGSVYGQFARAGAYLGLRGENEALMGRLADLQNEIERYRSLIPESTAENFGGSDDVAGYVFMPASVINNTITRRENFLTLDKGRRDGVEPNMAIVTAQGGIVGYVLDCSDKFSVGISVLNINFRTGGKIKGKENFGSIRWDGLDHRYVTLSDIPKYAEIAAGDTIVTGYSSIFPSDIVIGTVESFGLNKLSYYDVKVKLSTGMSSLRHIFLVRYTDMVERMILEEETQK